MSPSRLWLEGWGVEKLLGAIAPRHQLLAQLRRAIACALPDLITGYRSRWATSRMK
ncbi:MULTISPECIES: hypothetical protein [unclassified Microcoleus]|uniref:hypothetical protein n=1 Tax=unclassified Microcoleus TaxID=2642155 RepID=UPI002FD4B263